MAKGSRRPGAGRPKGSKSATTLEREAALKVFRELAIDRVRPLFQSQFLLAQGVRFVYRIDRHHRKGEAQEWITRCELLIERIKPPAMEFTELGKLKDLTK